ncbi:MAG: NfeD family protein [Rhizobiales bacterium]|nr:NfeD family protein [Hyphomicrobiales bacterium]
MAEFIPLLGDWFWWVVAGLLLMLELTAPGVFFIWLAIPAAVVGLLDMALDLGWQTELLVFAALSLVSVFAGRTWLKKRHVFDSDQPNLNQRMFDFVGRSYVLDEAIAEGRGRLVIDSTIWEVRGPDAPKGARVKVTGVDGLRLTVEPF